jgi:hypothetical protein
MTLFESLILFTNHYENLQEMLEMASFLRYVDLYLTSEWGRFYVGYSIVQSCIIYAFETAVKDVVKFVLSLCDLQPKLICAMGLLYEEHDFWLLSRFTFHSSNGVICTPNFVQCDIYVTFVESWKLVEE